MEIETLRIANDIYESLNRNKGYKRDVERMKPRDNDQEFNDLREKAHTAICWKIEKLEKMLKEL
jgi:hypothetical protein